jgi:hypothetical protein
MKRISFIPLVAVLLLGTKTLAGNLDVSGDLTASNLTAQQSITLGGVTQTNWNSLPLQGNQYVIVPEGTNDVNRGNNLLAAYTTATTLTPTSSNRVAVIVPPGAYNLGSTSLVMNTSYVDLIGLVPSQVTTKQVFTDSFGGQHYKTVANTQCPVLIYGSASAGTLVQNVDYVRIESVILTNTGSGVAYGPSVNGGNTVLRHVSMSSMTEGTTVDYSGQYMDCVSGGAGFGGPVNVYDVSEIDGTFIDCVSGDESFGGSIGGQGLTGAIADGTFIDCTGGDFSFAGGEGEANGTFKGCVGGTDSFAGAAGIADGTFINCVGGTGSFAGHDGGVSADNGIASGTFINCVGGDNSFASAGDANGTFITCVGGANSFGGDVGDGGSLNTSAKLQHCQGGAGSFGGVNMASQDFSYNVGGTNTFLMLPQLPTSASGLPSGSVWSSNGVLRVSP